MEVKVKSSDKITVADWLQCEQVLPFIAAMTGKSVAEVKQWPTRVVSKVHAIAVKQLEEVTPSDPSRVVINGTDYGIHPDFMDFEAGAMIDISEASTEDTKTATIAFLSAIFRKVHYRVGKRYEVEKYTGEQHEELLQMPLSVYRAAEGFFLSINSELKQTSLDSLAEVVKSMKESLTQ